MRFSPRLTLVAVVANAVLMAGLSPGSPVLAQSGDGAWEDMNGHCGFMTHMIELVSGDDAELVATYRNLRVSYETIEKARAKIPEAERSRQEYQDCIAKLPVAKKLVVKAVELENQQLAAGTAADPYLKKARDLGFEDYAGLVGIYASIRNGFVKRERLGNYLIVADDRCDRRFKATGVVGDYYILSVDDTDYCGFGLVQVALRRSPGVSYREGEWIKNAYFRIVGTEEFQKSNGFPVTLVVLEPAE